MSYTSHACYQCHKPISEVARQRMVRPICALCEHKALPRCTQCTHPIQGRLIQNGLCHACDNRRVEAEFDRVLGIRPSSPSPSCAHCGQQYAQGSRCFNPVCNTSPPRPGAENYGGVRRPTSPLPKKNDDGKKITYCQSCKRSFAQNQGESYCPPCRVYYNICSCCGHRPVSYLVHNKWVCNVCLKLPNTNRMNDEVIFI